MVKTLEPPRSAGRLAPHPVDERNPVRCTPDHRCVGHAPDHVHGPGCGHPSVPHGDHTCYAVDDHLHCPHGDHCDDHGPIHGEHVGAGVPWPEGRRDPRDGPGGGPGGGSAIGGP